MHRGVSDFRRYFRAFHPVLQRVSSFLTDIESCSVLKVWWTRVAAPPYVLRELRDSVRPKRQLAMSADFWSTLAIKARALIATDFLGNKKIVGPPLLVAGNGTRPMKDSDDHFSAGFFMALHRALEVDFM
jgi:hypothetical protein